MKKKFDDFSPEDIQRLANTAAGRQLIDLFQQQQGTAYSQVLADGQQVDMDQLKKSVSAFMRDPRAKALLQQLQEDPYGRNGR